MIDHDLHQRGGNCSTSASSERYDEIGQHPGAQQIVLRKQHAIEVPEYCLRRQLETSWERSPGCSLQACRLIVDTVSGIPVVGSLNTAAQANVYYTPHEQCVDFIAEDLSDGTRWQVDLEEDWG